MHIHGFVSKRNTSTYCGYLKSPWLFVLSVWEIRHGAIIALREILSSHAACAGVTKPLEPLNPSAAVAAALEARQANEAWLQDCAVRLLCIFALDRFGDFVSDQVKIAGL